MKLINSLLYNFVIINIIINVNKFILIYIDTTYLISLYSMLSLWILSESFVINQDIKILENKYNLLLSIHYNKIDLIYDIVYKLNFHNLISSSSSASLSSLSSPQLNNYISSNIDIPKLNN